MGKGLDRIKNWLEKREYLNFEKYLNQAEKWRNKRAKRDSKKYRGLFAHNYDDMLQRQYLNFKTNKFQLRLTILTIVGMLVAGFLSGVVVYDFSIDKSPELIVSLNEVYPRDFQAKLDVINKKDYFAVGLEGDYFIDDLLKGKIEFEENSIGREKTRGIINFSAFKALAIEECKNKILQEEGISVSEGVLRTCRRTHLLGISKIGCQTCEGKDIFLLKGTETINTEVECVQGKEETELFCELKNIF